MEIGRIENDGDVIIVHVENSNPENIRSPLRVEDTNQPQQQSITIETDDEAITPNRKKRKRFIKQNEC